MFSIREINLLNIVMIGMKTMLAFLSGKQYRYIAQDSKKDDCTEMVGVHMSDKPQHTGNIEKNSGFKGWELESCSL